MHWGRCWHDTIMTPGNSPGCRRRLGALCSAYSHLRVHRPQAISDIPSSSRMASFGPARLPPRLPNRSASDSALASVTIDEKALTALPVTPLTSDHHVTLYVEHCKRPRSSFSLRGDPAMYAAKAKQVVDAILAILGKTAHVNVHINGHTTREDFPAGAGPHRYQPAVTRPHLLPRPSSAPWQSDSPGKGSSSSPQHRVPPPLPLVPSPQPPQHRAPPVLPPPGLDPSVDETVRRMRKLAGGRDADSLFPRIGSLEVAMEFRDSRASATEAASRRSLQIFSKLERQCWPNLSLVQARVAAFINSILSPAAPPPYALGAATPSGHGFDAATGVGQPPPPADTRAQKSLYQQLCFMEAYQNHWWKHNPLPMLSGIEQALEDVTNYALKDTARRPAEIVDDEDWTLDGLLSPELAKKEAGKATAVVAQLLLSRLEESARRVGRPCDLHLQQGFLRALAQSGLRNEIVLGLLRQAPLDLSGALANSVGASLTPLEAGGARSGRANIKEALITCAKMFDEQPDPPEWPLVRVRHMRTCTHACAHTHAHASMRTRMHARTRR